MILFFKSQLIYLTSMVFFDIPALVYGFHITG